MKILLASILGLFATSGALAQGEISVMVEGIRNTKGQVYVTLQDSEQMYKSKDQFYKVATIEIGKGESSYTFGQIPVGTYVVTILHDENSDQKMTTNFVGMPKEGFGFSNNAKGKMGKPSFEAASFNVESGKTARQKIKFIYL